MTTVKSIGLASAFRIGLAVYGFFGLIAGAICSMLSIAGIPFAPHSAMRSVGVLAIVLCPIIYGLIGGLGSLIAAAVYNLVSGFVGGLEVEISGPSVPQPTPEPQMVR